METFEVEVINQKALRLEMVRSELKINKSELARRIDSPQSHINKVLKGNAPIGDLLSDKIIRRLHLNPVWWEIGEGEMFDKPSYTQTPAIKLQSNAEPLDMIDEDDVWKNWAGIEFRELEDGTFFMSVPLVEDYAEAGYLNGWNDKNFVEDLPKHSINVGKRHMGKYRAFRVRGDSMDDGTRNSICNRDIVVGRSIERHLWNSKFHLHKFEYYVIVHKEGLVVKRIAKHDTEKGIITCVSLNQNQNLYPDYDINLSDLYEIYSIVSVERRMGY